MIRVQKVDTKLNISYESVIKILKKVLLRTSFMQRRVQLALIDLEKRKEMRFEN